MINRYRVIGKILFVLYIIFLLYFLIFSRNGTYDEPHYNLIPFQEILRYWNYRDQLGMLSLENIVGNIVIFMPLSFLGAVARSGHSFLKTSLDGFLLSLVVEIFQLISRVGTFDVDDLILNTLGAILGYTVFVCCNTIRRMYVKNKKRA